MFSFKLAVLLLTIKNQKTLIEFSKGDAQIGNHKKKTSRIYYHSDPYVVDHSDDPICIICTG